MSFKNTKVGLLKKDVKIKKLSKISNVYDSLHETPEYSESGINMIRVTDIKSGFLKFKKSPTVDEAVYNKFTRNYNPKKGDIVISRVGSYNGETSFVDSNTKFCLGQNTSIINPLIDEKYLYYCMESKMINNQIEKFTVGSARKTISLKNIRNLLIPVPEKGIQTNIGSFLYNLDKKIEINNYIIETLEKIAQTIYKNWFIKFEPFIDEKFVDSELGMIPQNWEVGHLGDKKLTRLIRGSIDEFQGEKIYLATADVNNKKIENYGTFISYDDKPSRANRKPEPNTVWFAKMKDSKKLILVSDFDRFLVNYIILSTGFMGLKVKENALYYVWNFITNDNFERIKSKLCTGTIMEAINMTNTKKIKILIPPAEILKRFHNLMEPIYRKITNSKIENKKLKNLRETLLPKLISGEIRVI